MLGGFLARAAGHVTSDELVSNIAVEFGVETTTNSPSWIQLNSFSHKYVPLCNNLMLSSLLCLM